MGGLDALEDRLDVIGYPHDWDQKKHAMQECTDACWTIPTTTEG
jgi:hypothetical protein